jgi:hypothetical protein
VGYRELAQEIYALIETKRIGANISVTLTGGRANFFARDPHQGMYIPSTIMDWRDLASEKGIISFGDISEKTKSHQIEIKIDALRRFVTRTATIFYCWQSWSPSETNKDFILSALQCAVTEVNSRCGINLQIDSDTQGIAGSVGFSDTILKKITTCEIFVADLTAVGANFDNRKKLPNGNVMFEYGFATATHEPERIIVLHNSAFGKVEEFPSDVRHRMAIEYRCEPSSDEIERTAQLSSLRKKLVTELTYMAADIFPD